MSASYARGVGGDRDIADRITAATALSATTTSSAAVAALHVREVQRVAVLSRHVESSTPALICSWRIVANPESTEGHRWTA